MGMRQACLTYNWKSLRRTPPASFSCTTVRQNVNSRHKPSHENTYNLCHIFNFHWLIISFLNDPKLFLALLLQVFKIWKMEQTNLYNFLQLIEVWSLRMNASCNIHIMSALDVWYWRSLLILLHVFLYSIEKDILRGYMITQHIIA